MINIDKTKSPIVVPFRFFLLSTHNSSIIFFSPPPSVFRAGCQEGVVCVHPLTCCASTSCGMYRMCMCVFVCMQICFHTVLHICLDWLFSDQWQTDRKCKPLTAGPPRKNKDSSKTVAWGRIGVKKRGPEFGSNDDPSCHLKGEKKCLWRESLPSSDQKHLDMTSSLDNIVLCVFRQCALQIFIKTTSLP